LDDTGLLLADLQWAEINHTHMTRRLLSADNDDVPVLRERAHKAWVAWEAARQRYNALEWDAKRARWLIDLICHAPRFRMDP
jgi:hypothetical protein